jgi:hypothetical protein
MVFNISQRLVDPVQNSGHVARIFGDQHKMADGQHQSRTSVSKAQQSNFLKKKQTIRIETDRASSSRGSSGGYIALTTPSTLGPIRFAMATNSVMLSADVSCCELLIVMPTMRSVSSCAVRSIAKQCGTKPLYQKNIEMEMGRGH